MTKRHDRKQMEAAAELLRLTAKKRLDEAKVDASLHIAAAEMIEQLLAFIDRSAKKAMTDTLGARMRELSDVLEIELQVTDSSIIVGEPVESIELPPR